MQINLSGAKRKSVYFILANIAFLLMIMALNKIETRLAKPREFVFDPVRAGHIEAGEKISRVILAGSFNGWNPYDEKYELSFHPPGVYKITVLLEAGLHEYKFVLHRTPAGLVLHPAEKDKTSLLWLQDENNPKKKDDALGGFNSVIKIRSLSRLISLLKWLYYSFLFSVLAVIILYPLVGYVFLLKIKIKFKLLLLSNLLVFFLSFTKLLFDRGKDCELMKKADAVESRYLLRSIEGPVKKGGLSAGNESKEIETTLDNMIKDFLIQTASILPNEMLQNSLNYAAVFDAENRLRALAYPSWQSAFIEKNRITKEEFQKNAGLFYSGMYKKDKILSWNNFRCTDSDNVFKRHFYSAALFIDGSLAYDARIPFSVRYIKNVAQNILYNAYNGWCLAKIEYGNKKYGYLVFDNKAYTEVLFEKTLSSVFYFYLISSAISLIIFLGFGRNILGLVRKLDAAFNEVTKDRLAPVEVEKTGDELQNISESYNYMIDGLKGKQELLHYVSKSAWDAAHIRARAGLRGLSGERKTVTLLFSDIVNFTALTLKYPPDQVVEILNGYFEKMAGIISGCGGQVDKYIGDGMMAIFEGEPQKSAGHAVRAAIGMQNEIRAPVKNENIKIRIGIHTGEVIMGDIGSIDSRRDHTCIGRNVNKTQRLESICAPGTVLLSEEVFSYVRDYVSAVKKENIEIKGFEDAITVYELRDLTWKDAYKVASPNLAG